MTKSLLVASAVALLALAPRLACAESRSVVLSVPDMYSPACPVLARKALQKVDGVRAVQASLERKEAVVVFDDSKTSVDRLVEATKNAGFPNARAQDRREALQ